MMREFTLPTSILVQRLQGLLRETNVSMLQISKQADLNVTAVRDILAGRSKEPRRQTLERLAQVFNTDVDYLLGKHDHAPTIPPNLTRKAKLKTPVVRFDPVPSPIVGIADARTFRMKSPKDPPLDIISAPPYRRRPLATHFGLRVHGHGLPPSPFNYALCIDFNEAAFPVSDGEVYVVERTDDDRMYETTLRRAHVHGDAVELHILDGDEAAPDDVYKLRNGKSTNPNFKVEIVGIAYALFVPLSRSSF